MKKENYCVDVPDLKMAPIIRQTLEINGEKFNPYYRWDGNSVLLYSTCDSMWYWGAKLLGEKKQFVTFGQLIDLLNEPKKIAVRVDNEKEFKALMKHYDSLGWKWCQGQNATKFKPKSMYPLTIANNNDILIFGGINGYTMPSDYQIIPFSEFAEHKGIKLPLITTLDGIDLYEGDKFYTYFSDEGRTWGPHILQEGSSVLLDQENRKAFSTKQAALNWIEAQKPKTVIISPDSGYPIIVYSKPVCGNEYIHLDMSKRGDYNGANIHLTIDELRQAVKAYDEMHS